MEKHSHNHLSHRLRRQCLAAPRRLPPVLLPLPRRACTCSTLPRLMLAPYAKFQMPPLGECSGHGSCPSCARHVRHEDARRALRFRCSGVGRGGGGGTDTPYLVCLAPHRGHVRLVHLLRAAPSLAPQRHTVAQREGVVKAIPADEENVLHAEAERLPGSQHILPGQGGKRRSAPLVYDCLPGQEAGAGDVYTMRPTCLRCSTWLAGTPKLATDKCGWNSAIPRLPSLLRSLQSANASLRVQCRASRAALHAGGR